MCFRVLWLCIDDDGDGHIIFIKFIHSGHGTVVEWTEPFDRWPECNGQCDLWAAEPERTERSYGFVAAVLSLDGRTTRCVVGADNACSCVRSSMSYYW